MYPILGRIGPILVTSYQVIWVVGLVTGLWLWSRLVGEQAPIQTWFDPLLVGGFAGILAGRLVYVWLNWDYFQTQPHEAWQLRRGGLTYQAVLVAGLLASGLWSRRRADGWPALAAGLSLLLPWWHITGWAACLLEGCGYGRQAPAGWLVAALPDSYGVVELRYATQALALAWSLVALLLAVWWRRAGARPGRRLWRSVALLAAGGAGVALLRADPAPAVATPAGDLRLEVLVNAGLGLLAFVLAVRPPPRSRAPGTSR